MIKKNSFGSKYVWIPADNISSWYALSERQCSFEEETLNNNYKTCSMGSYD
jgi:hypothetical protein